MRVRYTPRAFSDLDSIRSYIDRHNPVAARRVVTVIEKIVARLGDFPEAGQKSDELDVRVIFTNRYPYRVYYRIVAGEISVLHIRHAARRPPEREEWCRQVSATTLRPYTAADEDAAIELWRRTWAQHYPRIDFNARVAWWRERWRQELVPVTHITLAEKDGVLAGFVTVDPKTMYLDQLVVAPEHWGSDIARVLVDEAKRLSPRGLEEAILEGTLAARQGLRAVSRAQTA